MRKLTTEEFINKARKIHGDKYDYSKVEYVNNCTKVCIICPEHGEFWQRPNSHLSGNGCSKCTNNEKLTTEEFIKRAKEIHGDKYDYSKVEYIDSHTKICIICPEHGEFWQVPYTHLNGIGCKKCGIKKIKMKNSSSLKKFIKRATDVHNNKYNYSKVEYINNRTPVCIICPEHGEFWQRPNSHLNGSGCPKCRNEKLSKERLTTNNEWINKVKIIHNNKYSYEKTIYRGYRKKVIITCPIHGEFEQLAYNHLQGKGCPKCRKSRLEVEIEKFLNSKNIKFIYQYRPSFLQNGKSHLSVDFYLPDYNVAIECQGKQHFVGETFYSQNIKDIIRRDKIKKELLEKNKIDVLYYTDQNVKEYFGKIFNSKNELYESIKLYEKLL